MNGRKRLLVVTLVSAGILAPVALFALFFLDPLLALPICAGALLIFLVIASGVKGRRRDKRDELLADAAQRGDQAPFLDRPHRW